MKQVVSFRVNNNIEDLIHNIAQKTNKVIERKPNIHLIIPKVNLATNASLNPCINCRKDIKFFEAI